MEKFVGMLAAAILIVTIVPVQDAHAQSACQVNSSLGRYICGNRVLSRINAETDSILLQKVRQVDDDHVQGLLTGIDAWYETTAEDCAIGRSYDFACVREMLISRRDALSAVDRIGLFRSASGAVWINLAARISRQAAIDLAYEYYYRTGRRYEFNVFLSQNGWYAVAYGPVWRRDYDRHLSRLQAAYRGIDPASYPTRGEGYTVFVTTARAPRHSAPPRRTSSRCSRERLAERQALCFIFVGGERICSEGLERLAADDRDADGDAGDSGVALGASVLCSSMAQAVRTGRVDIGVLAMSGALAGLDAVGESLMQEDDLLLAILGGAVRVTVASAQFAQATECARTEAALCGYR